MEIRRLRDSDDRSAFQSGDLDIDKFFRLYAGQNQFRHHIGTTYVAVNGASIHGFATISACSIEVAALPAAARKRLPHYPLPALRLARLGVHESAQRTGVAGGLLRFVFTLAKQMAMDVGCVGVIVDAKPNAVALYERLGFLALDTELGNLRSQPRPRPMFLPLAKIA